MLVNHPKPRYSVELCEIFCSSIELWLFFLAEIYNPETLPVEWNEETMLFVRKEILSRSRRQSDTTFLQLHSYIAYQLN